MSFLFQHPNGAAWFSYPALSAPHSFDIHIHIKQVSILCNAVKSFCCAVIWPSGYVCILFALSERIIFKIPS
jgi:hypothetical protein